MEHWCPDDEAEIKIVTLTVTGAVIILILSAKDLILLPDIVYDATHPEAPKKPLGPWSPPGRRDSGVGPFTCQSCDNLQGNGVALRQVMVALAGLSDQAF